MCRTIFYGRFLIFAVALAAHLPATAVEAAPGMLTIERFSAERGDANSQFFMGQRYEQGDGGVPRDLKEALGWYRKAAEQGHGPAQFKVGQFYEKGLGGLSARADVAKQWYDKAAQNGSDLAREWFAEQERSEAEREQRKAEAEAERRRRAELERERQRRAAVEQERRQAAAAAAAGKEPDPGPQLSPDQLLEHVAAGPWREAKDRPAEFLPTGDMNCLRSGERQVTCFSEERKRRVSKSALTFSVKAVLDGFSADGSFNVRYIYNVLEKEAVSADAGRDPYGLGLKRGWQQPGTTASCRLQAMSRLECEGAGFGKREFRAD